MPRIRGQEARDRVDVVTSDFTAYPQHGTITADASGSSPLIVNLPQAPTGRSIEITIVNVGASGTVIVDAYASETIDGALTYNLTTQWAAVTVESVPGGWVIAGGGGGGGSIPPYSDTVPNLGVATYQGAIESLLVAAPSTTFIYNSSGIQGGTRYNSWASLMTAISNTRYGGPRNILFEQNENIPVGTYDLTNIRLIGNGFNWQTGASIIVTFQGATTLTNPILEIGGGLVVVGNLSNPLITSSTLSQIKLFDGSGIGCVAGTSPIVSQTAGTCILAAYGDTTAFFGSVLLLAFGITNPVVSVSGSGVVAINQNAANSSYDDGIITSSYVYTHTVFYNTGNPAQDPARAAVAIGSGFVAPATVYYREDTQYLGYTPAVPANWLVVPTTTQQALDRIAAVLGPI